MNKYILLILIVTICFTGCKKTVSDIVNTKEKITNASGKVRHAPQPQATDIVHQDQTVNIKDQVFLTVPFAVQFPAGTLDHPYQEGCEEASIIMAKAYIDHDTQDSIPNPEVDNTMMSMFDWQNINWGGHYDLNASDTLNLLQDYYDISYGETTFISSIDDIKRILSDDKIIIAPTYGMKLENPYFTAPGPAYHMLVIIGYDEDEFITNDPGVGVGKNFNYSFENLFDAIHDLPEEANRRTDFIKNNPLLMENTPKTIITISR